MTTLRIILGDQLSKSISSLEEANQEQDIIFICETWEQATHVKHHKKKIAFLFSAMRHFAKTLESDGYRTEYIKLDDPNNTGTLFGEIQRTLNSNTIKRIVVTHPSEYHILEDIKKLEAIINIPIEIMPDNRFFCSIEDFANWAKNRKQLRMEIFYREMRRKYSILMNGDKPEGGKWNFDTENRKPPPKNSIIPKPYRTNIDDLTYEVIELVSKSFSEHFGDLYPFYFAVTRSEALKVLDHFIEDRLIHFGDYQDAMLESEPWMFHSHISFYLNCGLLLPIECVKAAENAYHQGKVPLNAVEGFIRQIIGWREYVRGIYWLKMPEYAQENFFEANRNLPNFYWTGDTKMNCLHQCISETKQNAYAHHIQRLMILGNFALLTGINPKEVNEWFFVVYADAFEWVELPNVSGMILFADGGYLASKPYAAGGSYINKMSNYCKNCTYVITKKNGPDACPFNYLYWDFLVRNREKLESNPRISMMYKTYDRMDVEKKQRIKQDSKVFLDSLSNK